MIFPGNFPHLKKAIATYHPQVFLETFLTEDLTNHGIIDRDFFNDSGANTVSPIDFIPEKIFLSWCKTDPEKRYPILASFILPYTAEREKETYHWNPLAMKVLEQAPNPIAILRAFESAFQPSFWSGSYVAHLEKGLALIEGLKSHKNLKIAQWADEYFSILFDEIQKRREREDTKQSYWFQSFE